MYFSPTLVSIIAVQCMAFYFLPFDSNHPTCHSNLRPPRAAHLSAHLSVIPLPARRVSPQELPEKWLNVKKQAVAVKQQVAPLQASEVAGLRRKCASFDVEQHAFREDFRKNAPFRWEDLSISFNCVKFYVFNCM